MSFCVEPIKAYLTRNTEIGSQMDPYVILTLGKQKHKTQVIQEGGKKPHWHEKFVFKAEDDNTLEINVFDEDNVTDDEVGSAKINIDTFLNDLPSVEKFVSLKFKKKPAGKILLRIQALQTQKTQSSQIQKTYAVNRPQTVQEQVYRPQNEIRLNSANSEISYFKNNRSTHIQGGNFVEPPKERLYGGNMYRTEYRTERNSPKINFSFSNTQRYGFSNTYSNRF